MFNGHMDTSYSGREPWLAGRGFRPEARVEGDYLFGLGISNMKGALACYVEAVRALQDAGVRLSGDVMIAAVFGEIEKTQWGDVPRPGVPRLRGRAGTWSRTAGSPTCACSASRPRSRSSSATTARSGCASRPAARSSTPPSAAGAASRTRSCACATCSTPCSSGSPPGRRVRVRRQAGSRQRRLGPRRLRLARLADAGRADLFLDVRVPPTKQMAVARSALATGARAPGRFPDHGIEGEVYVTAPGAEIDEEHELVAALDAGHEEVRRAPERDTPAGSRTRPCSPATGSRPSTTAPRAACPARRGRTSRSRGSSAPPRSTR